MSFRMGLAVSPTWGGDVAMLEGIVDSFLVDCPSVPRTEFFILHHRDEANNNAAQFISNLEGVYHLSGDNRTALNNLDVLIFVFDPDQENPDSFWYMAMEAMNSSITTIFYKGNASLTPTPGYYMKILLGEGEL